MHNTRPMQSSGTFKLIPLAPPATSSAAATTTATTITAKTSQLSRRDETYNRLHWASWLSPKIGRPASRSNPRHANNDRDSPTMRERRMRRASFDEPPSAAAAGNDDGVGMKGPSRDVGHHGFDPSQRPREKTPGDSRSNRHSNSSSVQFSLLTAFLFSLNELLPRYCHHLSSAADMGQSSGASNAIRVLEGGSTKRSSAPSNWNDTNASLGDTGENYGTKDSNKDTPQSRSPTFSPAQFSRHFSTGSPVKQKQYRHANEHYQQHTSLSPLRRHQHCNRGYASNSAPTSPQSKRILFDPHHMNKTTANEWERFVSPFLMLAAAEVLYGRMEHVIDPASELRFRAEKTTRSSDPERNSTCADDAVARSERSGWRMPFWDCIDSAAADDDERVARKSPLVALGFASRREGLAATCRADSDAKRGDASASVDSEAKRGSTRLVEIYRRIREDLVIVGEYLCDPVLGSRDVGCRRNQTFEQRLDATRDDEIPPLPYQDDESTNALTPKISSHCSDNNTNADKNDEEDTRRVAALSLRNTLHNLISFIEARCTLIRIHADIIASSDPSSRHNWVDLIQQCESISSRGDFMDRVDREAKALKLAMEIIHYLQDFDFFRCALTTRRLFVFLGPTPAHGDESFLPMMWIRSSFVRMLSLSRIMFSAADLLGTLPQETKSHPPSSNKKSLHKKEDSNSFSSEVPDFDVLSSEIIASNGLDPPLAIVVARRTQDNSWTAVYLKSSTQTVASTNKEKSPASQTQNQRSGPIWPLTMWSHIEHCLEEHSEGCKPPHSKYDIDSNVVCVEGDPPHKTDASLIDGKKGVAIPGRKPLTSHAGTVLHCQVASITKQVCLIVIRGAEAPSNHGKKRKVSDGDISRFMDSSVPQLMPENLLGVDVLLRTRTAMASSTVNTNEFNHLPSVSTWKTHFSSSLWDASEWSEKKQKQILNTLGLRKNSPVIAPLKSPYVKRHLSEAGRRRKKTKSTMNHGHLAFFLGTELSQII